MDDAGGQVAGDGLGAEHAAEAAFLLAGRDEPGRPLELEVRSLDASQIALRLAAERPELLRSLIAHEPPLFSLIAEDPEAVPMLEDVEQRIGAVVERIAAGDHAGAAEQFVEEVALGPGMWTQLPAEARQIMTENAPTFLDEARDPDQLSFDLEWLRGLAKPALFTLGGESPPLFASVVTRIAEALPGMEIVTLSDAGHIPQVTHPEGYGETVSDFTSKQSL